MNSRRSQASLASAHAEMRERAARCAAQWREPSALMLAAGEMTAQEFRAAQAVAGGIEAAIRNLPPLAAVPPPAEKPDHSPGASNMVGEIADEGEA